eukprot:scaffold48777_cov63-Phaeocystis_antarctica.AAC.1
MCYRVKRGHACPNPNPNPTPNPTPNPNRADRVKRGHACGDGGREVEAEQAWRQEPFHHQRQGLVRAP